MVLKSCFQCKFHYVKDVQEEQMSHCGKENCWAWFSKCVAKKALMEFLEQDNLEPAELAYLPMQREGSQKSLGGKHS